MTPLDPRQFRVLFAEALRDASRRRLVPVVLIICFFSLLLLNSCTSCNANIEVGGEIAQHVDVLGWGGTAIFGLASLWIVVLAGLLAADHLSQVLEDGSAALLLARPVGRATFALARLAGALVVAWGAGLLLLGGTSLLLALRSGLSLWPALLAVLACALGALTLAAISMTLSLYLPRVATFALLFLFVGLIAALNLAVMAGAELQGLYAVLDEMGPPLLSAVALALAPWSGHVVEPWTALETGMRLLLWAGGAVSMLVFCFRHRELE